MNPQNQKPENSNPDLDFIRNTTDPLEAPVKKGLDKKIIVIIVLVVITIGVLVFGMVTGANNKVQKSSNVQKSSDTKVSSETLVIVKDTINTFLDYVNANNIDKAYSLFSSNSVVTRDDFANESMVLFSKLEIDSCQPDSSDKGLIDKDNRIIQTYECTSKDDEYSVTVEFSLDSSKSGQLTIYYLNMVKIV